MPGLNPTTHSLAMRSPRNALSISSSDLLHRLNQAIILAFSHAVAADQAQPLLVENPSAASLTVPPDAGAPELYETGAAALSSGNTRSAIPLLEQLVKINPNYPQAWTQLGLAYMRARELDLAANAFQKELEINPDDPQVHNYLGLAYDAEHKDDAAIAAFRQQIALDPLDKISPRSARQHLPLST